MNGPSASLRLVELVASRLCHDLGGDAGTVSAALELAAEGPAFTEEALPVAFAAARALVARLRLLRAGWGAFAAPLTLDEIAALARGLGSPERPVTVDLSALVVTAPPRPDASRLLVNLLILAAESLPQGGAVACCGTTASAVRVTVEGPGAAWPVALAASLSDPGSAWRAVAAGGEASSVLRGLQAHLTALLTHESDFHLRILPTDGRPGRAVLLLRLGASD